ncbi:MAG: DUF167 domain-containing protein [Nanoarchaeota archaeon]
MAIPVFDLKPFISNQLIKIKVIPNASSTKLVEETGHLKLYLKAVPEKDKANKELIKFFKKEFKLAVEIKSGEKSREKVLRIKR